MSFFKKRRPAMLSIITFGISSTLSGIGRWIDKMSTLCMVVLILLLIVAILWLLTNLFGGTARG